MKALVYQGAGRKLWTEVPEPEIIESSDAIRMRISPDNSFFFCGSLTNAPLLASRCCHL